MEYLQQFEVASASTPGKTYRVSLNADQTWACSCIGWTRHVPRRDCQHISQVKLFGASNGITEVDPMLAAMVKAQRKAAKYRHIGTGLEDILNNP